MPVRIGKAVLVALCLIAAGTGLVRAVFDTTSYRVAPDAVDSGGANRATTTSYLVDVIVGEVSGSSATFTSYSLHPGLGNVLYFPGTVTNLTGLSVASTTARLTWTAPGYDGLEGDLQSGSSYYVQIATFVPTWSIQSASVIIGTAAVVPSTVQISTPMIVLPNTTHYARIWTVDAAGNGSYESNIATFCTLAPAPAISTAPFFYVGGTSVTVFWTALTSTQTTGYQLIASTAADFTGTLFSSATTSSSVSTLTVSGLSTETTYYFRVAALNHFSSATYSVSRTTVTIDNVPPAAITNLSALVVSYGGAIQLTWTAPGDDGLIGSLTSAAFIIQFTTDTTFATGASWSPSAAQPSYVSRVTYSTGSVSPGDSQSVRITGLLSGATYYFRAWTRDNFLNDSAISNGATNYAQPVILDVTLSTYTISLGALTPGATVLHASSITVSNTGNINSVYRLSVTNPAVWVSTSGPADVDQFRLTAVFKSTAPALGQFDTVNDVLLTSTSTASASVFAVDADPAGVKGFNVAPGEQRGLWLRIEMPPVSSTLNSQVITLNASAQAE